MKRIIIYTLLLLVIGVVSVNAQQDNDGDGVTDSHDRCPDKKGVARFGGCPIPDADKDRVNDEEDECPTIAGVKENGGCPVPKSKDQETVRIAAKSISFEKGGPRLRASSFPSLDKIAKILSANQNYHLDIQIYVEPAGDAERDKRVATDRATAIAAYLDSKGASAKRQLVKKPPIEAEPPVKNKNVDLKLWSR